jgi:RimJ/RimL family protein N-acetyltransferase
LDKERVISLISPENRASIRVAERLGEIPQGLAEVLGKEHLVYGIDREGCAWARRADPCSEVAQVARRAHA